MERTTTLIVALLVVGSLAAVPLSGMAQTTDTAAESNATNDSVAPGEQLAGVVGVQGAELDGEVQSRAYGVQVAQAVGNDSRAAVAAAQLGDLETRLDELEQRRASLDEARANGSMSEGEYRARMARLAAETRTVERLANQTNETVRGLPAETLRSNGIDASAIRALRDRSEDLTGPEVAEIAREIAGDRVGEGFGPERAEDRGPADRSAGERANGTDGRDRNGDAAGPQNDTGEESAANGSENATRGTTTETATETDQ